MTIRRKSVSAIVLKVIEELTAEDGATVGRKQVIATVQAYGYDRTDKQISNSIDYLRREGYVTYIYINGVKCLDLTGDGETAVARITDWNKALTVTDIWPVGEDEKIHYLDRSNGYKHKPHNSHGGHGKADSDNGEPNEAEEEEEPKRNIVDAIVDIHKDNMRKTDSPKKRLARKLYKLREGIDRNNMELMFRLEHLEYEVKECKEWAYRIMRDRLIVDEGEEVLNELERLYHENEGEDEE